MAYQAYDQQIREAAPAFYQGDVTWTAVSSERITYDLGEDWLTVFAMTKGYPLQSVGNNDLVSFTNWMVPRAFAIRTRASEHVCYEELFDLFCATTDVSREYCELREKNAQDLVYAMLLAQQNQWEQPSIDESALIDNKEETVDQGKPSISGKPARPLRRGMLT